MAVRESGATQDTPTAELDDLRGMLHEEINRLPGKYRDPVVLCYLEGRTHDQTASALGWPVGTVRGRLARARDLLRNRLTRRGLGPAGTICAVLFDRGARTRFLPPCIPPRWPSPARALLLRPRLGSLALYVLRSFVMTRMGKTIALTMALLAGGVALLVGNGARGAILVSIRSRIGRNGFNPRTPPRDRLAYPLPEHARARLGTLEFLVRGPGSKLPAQFGPIHHSRRRPVAGHVDRLGGLRLGSRDGPVPSTRSRMPHGRSRTLAQRNDPGRLRRGSSVDPLGCGHRPGAAALARHPGRNLPGSHLLSGRPHPGGAASGKDGRVGHTWDFITLWDVNSRTEYRRRLQAGASRTPRASGSLPTARPWTSSRRFFANFPPGVFLFRGFRNAITSACASWYTVRAGKNGDASSSREF